MITRVAPISDRALHEAAQRIQAGEVVAFPTETVYGLGANGLCPNAVHKIFEAKGRPQDNPLILHVGSVDSACSVVSVWSKEASWLTEAFWPGPLTLVLPRNALVPNNVSAGLTTVAVRMPAHPVALKLIELSGCPIAAPSANRSGRPSPTTAQHVLDDLEGLIPLILDGGACTVGVESTVLSLIDSPTLLRPGAVTREQIEAVIGPIIVHSAVLSPLLEGENAPSPGMKHRHYAPRAPVTIVRGTPERVRAYIREHFKAGDGVLYLGETQEAMAQRLFAALRELDTQGVGRIWAEAVTTDGMGLAVMNRLIRAAGFQVVDC